VAYSNQKETIYVWVDMEMTGLDPETCVIVQVAMVLTDTQLNEILRPIELTIWQPESVLMTMSPFVRAMHEKSGLLDLVRKSQVSLEDAERDLMEILTKHCVYRSGRLCGNSIYQDRRFLAKYLPAIESYLHYRQIDVSSVKELASAWYKAKYEKSDVGKHTALHDIRQSIAELKYYRQQVFLQN